MSKACCLVEVVSIWCSSWGMRESLVRYEIWKGRLGEEKIRRGRLVSKTYCAWGEGFRLSFVGSTLASCRVSLVSQARTQKSLSSVL